jgi:hypothetical protein
MWAHGYQGCARMRLVVATRDRRLDCGYLQVNQWSPQPTAWLPVSWVAATSRGGGLQQPRVPGGLGLVALPST